MAPKAKPGASGGKAAAGKGGGESSKGKGKGSKEGLGTCTYVKARHILCEKQGKIQEAYKKLQEVCNADITSNDVNKELKKDIRQLMGYHFPEAPCPHNLTCDMKGWLNAGDKVPLAEFGKLAMEYSECPSGKKGGDLGWFPRGKMAGPFQEVAFATPIGELAPPFKSTHGYHMIVVEGRRN